MDPDALILELHGGVEDSFTIAKPEAIRDLLANPEAFWKTDKSWQVVFLHKLSAALRTKWDVLRFLCLHSGSDSPRRSTNGKGGGASAFGDEGELLPSVAVVQPSGSENRSRVQHDLVMSSILGLIERARELDLQEKSEERKVYTHSVVEHLVFLAGVLCGSGTTVRSLKQIVAFATQPTLSNHDLHVEVLRALRYSIRCNFGRVTPIEVFGFGGQNSGIHMSGVTNWPFTREYGLWAMFRLENDCVEFKILSLQTSSGEGVSIQLRAVQPGNNAKGFALVVRAKDAKRLGVVEFLLEKSSFQTRRWHHIGVHHYTRRFFTSEIRVTLDGEKVGIQPLLFPSKVTAPLSETFLMKDLNGQAGPIYLFNESPNPATLYELAKNMCHEVDTMGDPALPGSGLSGSADDKTFESRVFLMYHPRKCFERICLDVYGGHLGTLMGNTHAWDLKSVQTTFTAIGGVTTIFPFLWQQASHNTNRNFYGSMCVVESINLLATLIEKHPVNQNELLRSHGPALLAVALERLDEEILHRACEIRERKGHPLKLEDTGEFPEMQAEKYPALFSAIVFLIEAAASGYGRGRFSELELQLERAILLNPSLWLGEPQTYAVDRLEMDSSLNHTTTYNMCYFRRLLILYLHSRVRERTELYQSQVTLEAFIDANRELYVLLEDGLEHVHQLEPHHDPMVNASRKVYEDRFKTEARLQASALLSCCVTLVKSEISTEEVRRLIAAIVGYGNHHPTSHTSHDASTPSTQSLVTPSSRPPGNMGSATMLPEERFLACDIDLTKWGLTLLAVLLQQSVPPKGLYPICASLAEGQGLAALLLVKVIGSHEMDERCRGLALDVITIFLCRVDFQLYAADMKSKRGTNSSKFPWSSKTMKPSSGNAIELFHNAGGYAYLWQVLSSTTPTSTLHSNNNNNKFFPDATPKRSMSKLPSLAYNKLLGFASKTNANSKDSKSNLKSEFASHVEQHSEGSSAANGLIVYRAFLNMAIMPVSDPDEPGEISSAQETFPWTTTATGGEDSVAGRLAITMVGVDDSQRIQNTYALSILLKLLPHMDIKIQQIAVQDLYLLLKFEPSNRQTFLQAQDWSPSLLLMLGTVMTEHIRPQLESSKQENVTGASEGSVTDPECQEAKVGFEMGVKLIVLLLLETFERKGAAGWKNVEAALVLRPLTLCGSQTALCVLTRVLELAKEKLLQRLQSDRDWVMNISVKDTFLESIFHLIYLAEALLVENDFASYSAVHALSRQESHAIEHVASSNHLGGSMRRSKHPSGDLTADALGAMADVQLKEIDLDGYLTEVDSLATRSERSQSMDTVRRHGSIDLEESAATEEALKELLESLSKKVLELSDVMLWRSPRLTGEMNSYMPTVSTYRYAGPLLVIWIRMTLHSIVTDPVGASSMKHSGRLVELVKEIPKVLESLGSRSGIRLDPTSRTGLLAKRWSVNDNGVEHDIFDAITILIVVECHSMFVKLRKELFEEDGKQRENKRGQMASSVCRSLMRIVSELYRQNETLLRTMCGEEDNFVQLGDLVASTAGLSDVHGPEPNSATSRKVDFIFHPWLLLALDSPCVRSAIQFLQAQEVTLQGNFEARLRKEWDKFLETERQYSVSRERVEMDRAIHSFDKKYSFEEIDRLQRISSSFNDMRRELILQWHAVTMENSNEVSVWSLRTRETVEEHWMYSDQEDSLRRRKVMKQNPQFDPHTSAVYLDSLSQQKSPNATTVPVEASIRVDDLKIVSESKPTTQTAIGNVGANRVDSIAVKREERTAEYPKTGVVKSSTGFNSISKKLTGLKSSLKIEVPPLPGNFGFAEQVDASESPSRRGRFKHLMQQFSPKKRSISPRKRTRASSTVASPHGLGVTGFNPQGIVTSPKAASPLPLDSTDFHSLGIRPRTQSTVTEPPPFSTVDVDSEVDEELADPEVNEAAVDPKVNEVAVDSKVNEAAVDSKVHEAATDSKVLEAAVDSKVNEAAVNSKVNEAAVDSKVHEAAVDSKVNDDQIDGKPDSVSQVQVDPNQGDGLKIDTKMDKSGNNNKFTGNETTENSVQEINDVDNNLELAKEKLSPTSGDEESKSPTNVVDKLDGWGPDLHLDNDEDANMDEEAELEVTRTDAQVAKQARDSPQPPSGTQLTEDLTIDAEIANAGNEEKLRGGDTGTHVGSEDSAHLGSTDLLWSALDKWAEADSKTQRGRQYARAPGEVLVHVSRSAKWITPLLVMSGRVEVSTLYLYFYSDPVADQDTEVGHLEQTEHNLAKLQERSMMRWKIEELFEAHGRRYLLRSTALEFFFRGRTNVFISFPSPAERKACFSAILQQEPPNLERAFTGSLAPIEVYSRSGIQEKWRRREISNFEYLMRLNTIAGRSYNDTTQYPVFPWVLSDYCSDEIDLEDPTVFRDLSKPMGALNPKRLAEFIERYDTFDSDMEIPAFHYGSHYSSAGVVLHYLLRQEPFTSLAIELQGGRFDCPDRLFFSVADCWKSCLESMSDVKELIPEFYYSPEMFVNSNRLDLGQCQESNRVVDDVELPPWAKGSPDRFVQVMREALESEHVSQHLHEWIDLIFGYKQVGEEAVKAHNVFYYLTYEGAVDLDSIDNPTQRQAVETQIFHFGQTPAQLLTNPHPQRIPLKQVRQPIAQSLLERKDQIGAWVQEVWSAPAVPLPPPWSGTQASPPTSVSIVSHSASQQLSPASKVVHQGVAWINGKPKVGVHPPCVSVTAFPDRVVIVHEDLTFEVHRWISKPDADGKPYSMKYMPTRVLPCAPLSLSARSRPNDRIIIGTKLGTQMRVGPEAFGVSASGKLLLSCAFFDSSVRAHYLDNLRIENSAVAHSDCVLCLSVSEDGETMVTGSKDCTVVIWRLGGALDSRDEMLDLFGTPELSRSKADSGRLTLVRQLHGHTSPVTAVSVSSDLGVVVSGSRNGTVLVHTLHDGNFVRALKHGLFTDSDPMSPIASPMSYGFISPKWGNEEDQPITLVRVGFISGCIVFYSKPFAFLEVYSVNGKQLAKLSKVNGVNDMVVLQGQYCSDVIVTVDDQEVVTMYDLQTLQVLRKMMSARGHGPLRCVTKTPDGHNLLVGAEDGNVIVYSSKHV